MALDALHATEIQSVPFAYVGITDEGDPSIAGAKYRPHGWWLEGHLLVRCLRRLGLRGRGSRVVPGEGHRTK